MDYGRVAVSVVGLGLIGGSLCYGFKKANLLVTGVGSSGSVERALQRGIIERGFAYEEFSHAVGEADFVFICTPLRDIEKRTPDVLRCAKKGAIISDVGSTKSIICRIAQSHARRGVYFIGGHPMAGSEKRGIENANPYLFYDAVYVLAPPPGVPKRALNRLSSLISLLGAKVMILEPRLHDRIAASVSHLPQLLAVLLTNHLAKKKSDLFRNLAAGGFRDMTRIASSSYTIWRDIIHTNREEIKESLLEYSKELDALIDNLDNDAFLEDAFQDAQNERKTIPRFDRGFLRPLNDLRVGVKDRPGEIAKITNIIYYYEMNIKDIEIVSIREGEGGILRLGFSAKRDAQKAASLLREMGYEVIVVD